MEPERYGKASGEWSEEDHVEERLNLEVYLALSQGRADILAPIVALLRSNVGIDPIVRNALADAFEGKRRLGSRIEFRIGGQDSGSLPGWATTRSRFVRDLEIATRIAEVRAEGLKRHLALTQVAAEFLIGEDSCRRAMGIKSRFDAWLEQTKDLYVDVGASLPMEMRQVQLREIYFQSEVYKRKVDVG